jgi:sulfide dehydrogenase cytochrome subunit
MILATRLVLVLAFAVPLASADAATPAPPPGAAACSGCHPASQGEFPHLGGRSAPDIVAAMKAFRSGERPSTVMDRLAKGFGDDEVAAIAEWYAAQQ